MLVLFQRIYKLKSFSLFMYDKVIPLNFETNLNEKSILNCYRQDSILIKATILREIIKKNDLLDNILENSDVKPKGDYSGWISSLKLDIHSSMFHAIETLFTLMFVTLEEPDEFWLRVSNYSPRELVQKVRAVAEDINLITDENLITLFYKCFDKNFIEKLNKRKLFDSIRMLLKGAALEFSDKEEYNAYKHGGRYLQGATRAVIKDSKDNLKDILGEGDCIIYLRRKEGKLFHKLYDYESDFQIIKLTYNLLDLLINQRKLECGSLESGTKINTIDFSKEDIEGLMNKRRAYIFIGKKD